MATASGTLATTAVTVGLPTTAGEEEEEEQERSEVPITLLPKLSTLRETVELLGDGTMRGGKRCCPIVSTGCAPPAPSGESSTDEEREKDGPSATVEEAAVLLEQIRRTDGGSPPGGSSDACTSARVGARL